MPTDAFSVNVLVPICNVLIFVVLQSLFWWYIGSGEVEHIVRKKAQMMGGLRRELRRNPDQQFNVRLLDSLMLDVGESIDRAAIAEQAREARAKNVGLLRKYMLPWLAVSVLLIVGLVVFNRSKGRSFTFSHRMALIMVILAYAGEVLLFLYVIKPFVTVGDMGTVRTLTA